MPVLDQFVNKNQNLCKPKAVMSPFNKAKMSPLSIRGARGNDHDEPSRDRQAGGYSTS